MSVTAGHAGGWPRSPADPFNPDCVQSPADLALNEQVGHGGGGPPCGNLVQLTGLGAAGDTACADHETAGARVAS